MKMINTKLGYMVRQSTIAVLLSLSVWSTAAEPPLVRVRLRDKTTKYGQIQSFSNGSYHFYWVDGKNQTVLVRDISAITYKPQLPEGFIASLKTSTVGSSRPMTEADALQFAIRQLREERKDERQKRLALAQDNVAQLGLGTIVGTITEDIQDNLLGMLAEDRELQNIILDKDIQKTLDSGDYLSLMNNEKILNLMRNTKKVEKMKDALLGNDEEEKKIQPKKADEPDDIDKEEIPPPTAKTPETEPQL